MSSILLLAGINATIWSHAFASLIRLTCKVQRWGGLAGPLAIAPSYQSAKSSLLPFPPSFEVQGKDC